MSHPTIQIKGNLTAEPTLKFLGDGTPVANLTIATNSYRKTEQGWEQVGDASFWECTAWKDVAESIVSADWEKGQAIIVEGTIQIKKWEDKDGNQRQTPKITITQASENLLANLKRTAKQINIQ